MVTIRPAFTSDINELVSMYKEVIKKVYPGKKLGSDYHFYKVVINWIDSGHDIVVTENNGIISGFCMGYVDNMSGLIAPVYYGSEIFVKSEYRNTRAFYLMQKNIIKTAQSKKMDLISDAIPEINHIHKKLGGVLVTLRNIKEF